MGCLPDSNCVCVSIPSPISEIILRLLLIKLKPLYVTCEEQPIWICHCSELFCNMMSGFFHPRTSFQVESLVLAGKCSCEELEHSLFGRFLIPYRNNSNSLIITSNGQTFSSQILRVWERVRRTQVLPENLLQDSRAQPCLTVTVDLLLVSRRKPRWWSSTRSSSLMILHV